MVHSAKAVTAKPVENKFYTVTYTENGEKHKMKVEKGIELAGTELSLGLSGAPKTTFKTKGQNDVTLPATTSPTQIAMLKAFAGADGKAELTKKDVEVMHNKEHEGILKGYINARTPEGTRFDTDNLYYNHSNTFDMSVTDKKAHKDFGLSVQTPSAKFNPGD